MPKIEHLGIEDALNRLQEKFPEEHLEAHYYGTWYGRKERVLCLAITEREGLASVCGYGATWDEAQAELESNMGSRDPMEIKRAKVAQLEAELAKLQGEAT